MHQKLPTTPYTPHGSAQCAQWPLGGSLALPWTSIVGLVLLAALASPASVSAGSITGSIPPGKLLTKAVTIDRQSNKTYTGKVNAETGQFVIDDLPAGTYDCLFDFGDARLEGVNFQVPPSEYEEEQPLSEDDVDVIKTKVLGMNKFEDQVEVLAIEGNIQHAVILLNKLRTKPFYESKPGEVIWRAELWHFERPEETWLKVQDEMFIVLYRERIQRSLYDKKSLTFDPRYGGLKIAADDSEIDVGQIEPPVEKRGVRLRMPKPKPANNRGETSPSSGEPDL
jgi:hypothetical protein